MNLTEATQINFARTNALHNSNNELGFELVLEDADGHNTFYADPELTKAILNFLKALN